MGWIKDVWCAFETRSVAGLNEDERGNVWMIKLLDGIISANEGIQTMALTRRHHLIGGKKIKAFDLKLDKIFKRVELSGYNSFVTLV